MWPCKHRKSALLENFLTSEAQSLCASNGVKRGDDDDDDDCYSLICFVPITMSVCEGHCPRSLLWILFDYNNNDNSVNMDCTWFGHVNGTANIFLSVKILKTIFQLSSSTPLVRIDERVK